jgi:Na+-transporting methylmalonyl-CoA/oxaloacetate decarboxylase beta subunit
VYNLLSPVLELGAIGIIGGEDGPTAIYLTSKLGSFFSITATSLFLVLLLFEITFILNLYFSRKSE